MKHKKHHNQFKENPFRHTIDIIVGYIMIGISWIFLSDKVLEMFINDNEVIQSIQTLKGVLYVLITGALFYFIIKRRMNLYAESNIHLSEAVEALEKSNKSLKSLEDHLYKMAFFDDLTGYFSSNKLKEEIRDFIDHRENELLGFVYIDIDNFKEINETKGHALGDRLIKLIADNISQNIGKEDIVARLSGDELVVLLKNHESKESLIKMISVQAKKLSRIYQLDKDDFYVSISAGVSVYPYDGQTYDDLLKAADLALSIAKTKGKNRYIVYDQIDADKMHEQVEIANQLYYANKNEEFVVFYQPIVTSNDLKIDKVEALVRWNHPFKGLLSPNTFISIAEKTGHIREMTWFVIRESFKQHLKWMEAGHKISISINLSYRVLMDEYFLTRIKTKVQRFKIDPKYFIFELTESMVAEELDKMMEIIDVLRGMGFKIALDDFGTGYSSLTYLQKLKFDILKIDRSFISSIESSSDHIPVIEFMVNMAHHLKMMVVAEGIELEKEFEIIKKLKSDYVQGYFFAKPNLPEHLDLDKFR